MKLPLKAISGSLLPIANNNGVLEKLSPPGIVAAEADTAVITVATSIVDVQIDILDIIISSVSLSVCRDQQRVARNRVSDYKNGGVLGD